MAELVFNIRAALFGIFKSIFTEWHRRRMDGFWRLHQCTDYRQRFTLTLGYLLILASTSHSVSMYSEYTNKLFKKKCKHTIRLYFLFFFVSFRRIFLILTRYCKPWHRHVNIIWEIMLLNFVKLAKSQWSRIIEA